MATRTTSRRASKGGGEARTRAEIVDFATLIRRELDSDQIRELIRRTPGITPTDRIISYNFLADNMYDVDNGAQAGVSYHRTSVGRHLRKVIPCIELRYLKDKAGA